MPYSEIFPRTEAQDEGGEDYDHRDRNKKDENFIRARGKDLFLNL
jgi:hypothetical protein